MNKEEQIMLNLELHAILDTMVAQYLIEHPGTSPSKITILDLITWSYNRIARNERGTIQ